MQPEPNAPSRGTAATLFGGSASTGVPTAPALPAEQTFEQLATAWFARQVHLRPASRARYEVSLRRHLLPQLGALPVSQLDEEHVAAFVARLEQAGYAAWTIRSALTPLGRILRYAVRRRLIASNPMLLLERSELPTVGRREQRVLTKNEIERLIEAAHPKYRVLLATAAFTGLRLGELLALVWADVDLDNGFIHVHETLDRNQRRQTPKTHSAIRDVVLMPTLAAILGEHRGASRYPGDHDPVFASRNGTPIAQRNAQRRGMKAAAQAAGLERPGAKTLRMHDLRHTFASLLISQGANVVFVSRQLGHASPAITLHVYAHLFDRAQHAETTKSLLERSFSNVLATMHPVREGNCSSPLHDDDRG
jgi:integrase